MSTHNEHDDRNNEQVESSGIKARPILLFLGILAVSTAFVFFLIQGLLYAFDKMEEANKREPSTRVELPEGQTKLPPEPRLQGAPGPEGPSLLPLDEMKAYKKEVNERANGYGWVNKEAGTVYIPIERAKLMVVERGLPTRSETSIEEITRAETTRKLVLNADSNGGRSIK